MILGCGATRGGAVMMLGQALDLPSREGLSSIYQHLPLGEVSRPGFWCAANFLLLA